MKILSNSEFEVCHHLIVTIIFIVVFLFQAVEDISKTLTTMKAMLYGSGDQEPQTELTAQLAQEMYNNNMLLLLIQNLARIEFEVSCSFWT